MKKISFIHAADLHLDSPMIGLKHLPPKIYSRIKESTFVALRKLIDTAINKKVDFVVFAGDLFDGEDRSLRAQSRFRTEMNRLAENEIPVFIVHGNHDHLEGSWVHLDLPKNVHVFPSNVELKVLVTKEGVTVHLYGFSFATRHIFDRKIEEYYKEEGADFHIGILHGNELSGTEHDNYAPFTLQELQKKAFDYWALGHIHKRMVLAEDPFIVYSGNTQGRNKKETGAKGVYYVSLTTGDSEIEFVETSDVVWEEVTIDASSTNSFQGVLQLCQSTLGELRKTGKGTLVNLVVKNIHLEDSKEKRSLNTDLLDLLLDQEADEENFVWVSDISVIENYILDKEKLKSDSGFFLELFKTTEQYDKVEKALAPLYEHQLGKRYLSTLSSEEQQILIQQAEKLLVQSLFNDDKGDLS